MRKKPALLFATAAIVAMGVAMFALINGRIVHTPEMDTIQRLRVVGIALEKFRKDQGRLPTQAEGLMALVGTSPKGYFVDAQSVQDAWGRTIVYRKDDQAVSSYVIYSLGENGKDDLQKGDDILPRDDRGH